MAESPDPQPPQGVVELREDVPLKPGAGSTRTCSGPRAIVTAFAALTAAITLALFTQIYYGDYEVVPHGSVSSSAAECSRAGADALRAGGRAADAAAAAALCLAVLAPHRTSPDASGSMVYWEYRSSRTQLPTVVEWGGAEGQVGGEAGGAAVTAGGPLRLLVALAAVHARLGALPWDQILQPAIDLARNGFIVSPGLAAAAGEAPGYATGARRTEPALADYLQSLQHNTSAALCMAWSCDTRVRWGAAAGVAVGGRRVWAGGAGGARAAAALAAAEPAPDNTTVEDAVARVVSSLQQAARAGAWPGGVASGLAVVDPRDTYAALVTGLSQPFGTGAGRDAPTGPLDLAPAIVVDQLVCGTRYVVGAESGAALAQGLARALAGEPAADAAEAPRALVRAGGMLLPEPATGAPAPAGPPPALNLVQQRGDALLSHADSRGGGLAARF